MARNILEIIVSSIQDENFFFRPETPPGGIVVGSANLPHKECLRFYARTHSRT